MPDNIFDDPDTGSGHKFDDPGVTPGPVAPTIVSQPPNQTGIFNVAQTYDASVHATGVGSYGFATTPPAGVTIDGVSGIVSRATLSQAGLLSIPQIVLYQGADQTGPSASLNAFTWNIDYDVAAVTGDAANGWRIQAGALLSNMPGSHKVEGATYGPPLNLPAGWTAPRGVAGDTIVTPDAGAAVGDYTITHPVWNGSTLINVDFVYTVRSTAQIASLDAIVNKGTGIAIVFSEAFNLAAVEINGVPQANIQQVSSTEYTFDFVRDNGPGTALRLGQPYTLSAIEA